MFFFSEWLKNFSSRWIQLLPATELRKKKKRKPATMTATTTTATTTTTTTATTTRAVATVFEQKIIAWNRSSAISRPEI